MPLYDEARKLLGHRHTRGSTIGTTPGARLNPEPKQRPPAGIEEDTPYYGRRIMKPVPASAAESRIAREIQHGRYLAEHAAEEAWGWSTPAGQLRARRRSGLILEGARLNSKNKVLEIGCGTGLFTEIFATSGANIIAVEPSPDLLSIAKERNLAGVTFLEKNFEDCDADGPFDAIIGNSVLHHLDLQRTWPRIFSLLKPGGRLSFAEPNMLNPQIFCERHFRRFFPYTSADESAFVRWALEGELRAAGFNSIEIRPFDWLHPATPERFIGTVLKVGKALETIWPVREFAGSLSIWASRPG